eukprot:g2929.t1
MSSQPSKGNQIHPITTQKNDSGNGEEGNSGIQKKISVLNPNSQGAKEIEATLSKNAKLEKDFTECFSTPEERSTFLRATRFLEKHLVDFANNSTKMSQETLHFSREFLRGMRSRLEGDSVADATAKEESDFDKSDCEKVKVKEKEKEDDPLAEINNGRKHSIVEQLAQRETAEIKFTFKRVITSNHEPYEVVTKDTIGKWLIGEKGAKRLLVVGASLGSVALSGTQRLAVISFMPMFITATITDSIPRSFVKKTTYGYFFAIILVISTIFALKQLSHDPKLDFHLPIFGTYSLTGIAMSALYNYIIMMTKLFVVSVWNPKNFVMLKVPLQSTKMMENRANMILVTAEKEKLYKKIGEGGQKLITAIVGSPSDVPWEFNQKTSKSMLFTRLRMDEKHQLTSDTEFKLEIYTKQTVGQSYRQLQKFEEYKVIHEQKSSKGNVSPALPSMLIMYRRIKVPYPGVSDRLLCIKSHYRYYPEYGFAIVVTQDAEKKYVDQIPNKRVAKKWDKGWNGEGSSLFRTEEAIKNIIDKSEGSTNFDRK